jgi:GNAT superfamily N-acetyltransferase
MSPVLSSATVRLRDEVKRTDPAVVREIVASTGFFHSFEIDVAVELVEDRLARGEASDYHFVFVDIEGRTLGYACFGPIACTQGSFDLYWIAVHDSLRGRGLGRKLLEAAETRVAGMDGNRVYIETSSRPLYEPTRIFYEKCGYAQEARLADFYAPGDDKIIFSRRLF